VSERPPKHRRTIFAGVLPRAVMEDKNAADSRRSTFPLRSHPHIYKGRVRALGC
jgi:hypothetical protein